MANDNDLHDVQSPSEAARAAAADDQASTARYRTFAVVAVLATLAVGALLWFLDIGSDDNTDARVVGSSSDPITFDIADPVDVVDDTTPVIDGDDEALGRALQVVEATWTASPLGGTDLLFLYRNVSDTTFVDLAIQIDVFGENDELIATEIATAAYLPPGRTFAASRVIDAGADTVRFFRLTADAEDTSDEDDGYWLDVGEWASGDDRRIEVRGTVEAAFDRPPDDVTVVSVYRDEEGRFAGSAFDRVPGTSDPQDFVARSWPNRAVFGVEVYIGG